MAWKTRTMASRRRRSPVARNAAQKMAALLREGRDLRDEKVQRIRAAICADSYENGLKLEVALERMIERM